MAIETFEKLIHQDNGLASMNQVYWTGMLQRAHIASCTSLRRNSSWIDATSICYLNNNYLGFAASLRGLIESVGDSADVLAKLPKNIAQEYRLIKQCIDGEKDDMGVASGEMEDELIHYAHARKAKKNENVPESHIAKQTQYYVKLLSTTAQLVKLEIPYKELCEVMHPAATSVLYQFATAIGPSGEALYKTEANSDNYHIRRTIESYRDEIQGLVYLAFDPGLITLKVLHRFALFPRISELRNFEFNLHKLDSDSQALLRG
jgi:hypothetical protein